jgi:hypothetical protein
MERAEKSDSEKAWLSVAKFGLAAGSLIETGMRSCGILAGGSETAIQVHVDNLVILPTPGADTKPVIDVTAEDKELTS